MPKVTTQSPGIYSFICPGCKDDHSITTKIPQSNGAIWSFNGNVDRPTFSPSLLMKRGHYADYSGCNPAECYFCKEYGADSGMCYVCHSFVTDGKIQFLGDCTHELAGQTVELPEVQL